MTTSSIGFSFSGIVNIKLGNEILEKALEVIKEKKCPGYVVDSSQVKGTSLWPNLLRLQNSSNSE